MKRSRVTTCLLLAAAGVTAGILLAASGCGRHENAQDSVLTIFHAGSMSVPLREVSDLFSKEHPEIVVQAEAAGSVECARKIRDLGKPCDVMVSSDYNVVADLLMPEYAEFNVRFALNEMVIACTDRSRSGSPLNAENWHKVLLAADVAFGRADPNADPCGYRTLMVFQLAEKHYNVPGLARDLTVKNGAKYIRPKETDMLALLESGEIDCLFIYRSVAQQHGLKMLLLPDEVNLKSPALASLYATATVTLPGRRPGVFTTVKGESMVYSVTIPRNAPNRRAAGEYVALLLSPRGRAIMEKNGQPWSGPAQADKFEHLPESLKPFCIKAEPDPAGRRDDG